MNQKSEINYYITLSIIAVFLLLLLIYFGSSKTSLITFSDRQIITVSFIICCLFGISLTFYPRWYKKILKTKKNLLKIDKKKTLLKRNGHHPDCDQFKNHVIKLDKYFLCTGCFGLAIGSIISIFLMIIYIALINGKNSTVFVIFFYLGLIIITLNFIEIIHKNRNRFIHIFSNIFSIIGFLLIFIGVFEITGSKTYAIFTIIFSILWIYTRIQFSNQHHNMICNKCKEKCKMY